MKKKLAILCILTLIISLCACGSPSPTDVTGQFLDAFKAKDNETIKTVYADKDGFDFDELNGDLSLDGSDMPKTNEYLTESVYPKFFEFDYELSNEKINDDKASVDVTVVTYALGDAYTMAGADIITELFSMLFTDVSDDELDVAVRDIYKDNFDDVEKHYTDTVTVSLSKTADGWVVDEFEDNEDLLNAILGNMIEALDEVEDSTEE